MKQKKFEFIKPIELGYHEDDNWTDYYLLLSEIKKGDTFYECDHGRNVKLTALSNPKETKDGWLCKVRSENYGDRRVYTSAATTYLNANFSKIPLIMSEYNGYFGYIVE